ncbi:hypothetical protein Poli38472_003808 [Pythium oligandrum]|uniref:Uncharacterized protein n=1 Tax=Pythium oligandrum TaxID=41045 RepID=A0A8K1FPX3_PYTOL|nr:hypothetical protein Poli38472_003808 [Pythium oligandrum]|eukprot:TMW66043.1 hypothetical protein Poli38472_003808 [Pythium oligandrum]
MASRGSRKRPRASTGRSLREDVLALIQRCKPQRQSDHEQLLEAYNALWTAFRRVVGPQLGGSQCETDAISSDRMRMETTQRLVELSKRFDMSREILLRCCVRSIRVDHGRTQGLTTVLWLWWLHSLGIWRLEDVLMAMAVHAREGFASTEAIEWFCLPCDVLLEATDVAIVLDNENGTMSTHSVVQQMVWYLMRVAFVNPATRDEKSFAPSSEYAAITRTLVRLILTSWCDVQASTFSMQATMVLFQRAASIVQASVDKEECDVVRTFVRENVQTLLVSVAEDPATDEMIDQLTRHFQLCVSAVDASQLLWSIWVESAAKEETQTRRTKSKSARLARIIAQCATRDDEFTSHALTMAHDLAREAINTSDPVRLRQSFELTAAVTHRDDHQGEEEDLYASWFRAHFALTDSSSPSECPQCLRSQSGGSCTLISTKRHLLFLCAFLLESDRSEQRASHVFAHLSALKTHQNSEGASAVSALLSDFCAQTRARHAELQRAEETSRSQQASDAQGCGETDKKRGVKYTSSTIATVQELVSAFGEDKRLPPQVNRWKMFQPQQWKTQLLPCCLDVTFWTHEIVGENDASAVSSTLVHLSGLVHTLAKQHVITVEQYEAFLQQMEAWIQQNHRQLTSQRHQRRPGEAVAALRSATMRYEDMKHLVHRNTNAEYEDVADAFVVAFEELVDLTEATRMTQMRELWELTVGARDLVTTTFKQFVEQHLVLWIRLLSSENAEAPPEARMEIMEAFCDFALSQATSVSAHQVLAIASIGALAGLLASLPVCEIMATKWIQQIHSELLHRGTGPLKSIEPLEGYCVFLAAFLVGFSRNQPTELPPQVVLQTVLPPDLCDAFVWLSHHLTTWWSPSSEASMSVWHGIAQCFDVVRPNPWFRFVTMTSRLSSASQWEQVFRWELCGFGHRVLRSNQLSLLSLVRLELELLAAWLQECHTKLNRSPIVTICCVVIETLVSVTTLDAEMQSQEALNGLVMLFKDACALSQSPVQWISERQMLLEALVTAILSTQEGRSLSVLLYTLECMQVLLSSLNADQDAVIFVSEARILELLRNAGAIIESMGTIQTVVVQNATKTLFRLVQRVQASLGPQAYQDIPSILWTQWSLDTSLSASDVQFTAVDGIVESLRLFHRQLGAQNALFAPVNGAKPLSSRAPGSVQIRIQSLQWEIDRHLVHVSSGDQSEIFAMTLEATLTRHSFASCVIQALSPSQAPLSAEAACEIADCCVSQWLLCNSKTSESQSTSRFLYEMTLVHMLVEIATGFATVGRRLLRQSSEISGLRSLLWLLMLSIASETEQIDVLLAHHASLWVNSFSGAACDLMEMVDRPKASSEEDSSVLRTLQALPAFRDTLKLVLDRVLSFAAKKHVDILDVELPARVAHYFPVLEAAVKRVPVLCIPTFSGQ